MRNLKYVAAICAALVAMPSLASAYYPPKPPMIPPPHTTGSATFGTGAAATTGFLAFVAVLAGYDLLRRTTCIGDPWGLGGPGFTEPMPNGNVMIPQCRIVKARNVVRARG
jgi:hypothetical protein